MPRNWKGGRTIGLSVGLWKGCMATGAVLMAAPAASADPREEKYGFWLETYGGFIYRVDTRAQLCFGQATTGPGFAMAQVPCESLARREEWKPILTWVEAAPDAKPAEDR